VYQSSLTAANVTTAVSFDGGHTFVPTPVSTINPVDDRQWNAAYGANLCYLSYRNGATQPGNFLECVRLDYTGMGAPVIGPTSVVWAGLDPTLARELGNMVTDRRPGANATLLMSGADGEGNVYHGWTEEGHRVFVSVSHDFGTTWTHRLVWDGGIGSSYDHKFTWLAVDGAGNVYNVFSDDRNVYLSSSTDQGVTWSLPIRVNRGDASNIAIYPQIAAGSEGRVVITFYGHSGTSSQDPDAEWKVFVSRCQNALAAVPLFEEVQVSDRDFHHGPVCEEGLSCACCRELTECFDIDIDPADGSAALAYGAFGAGGTYISRQLAGASSIDGKTVTDRSSACPVAGGPCITPGCEVGAGDRCTLPGVVVACDPANDESPIGGPGDDITEILIAEPHRDDDVQKLTFTMKVSSLDPNSLPPSRVWYTLFTPSNGTTTYFVDMSNCDPTAGPMVFEYGTFDATLGFQTTGNADEGKVNLDGSIEITISRSLVGDPPAGSTLNGVHGDVRVFAGALCNGLVSRLDFTGDGSYTVMGNCQALAVGDAPQQLTFGLAGANPFRGSTSLRYSLPERLPVRIDVYSVTGQRVRTLVDREEGPGSYQVPFTMHDDASGRTLPAGVYMVRIKAGKEQRSFHVIVLK